MVLDAARHQLGAGRLSRGALELATQVAGRHVHAVGQRLHVERLLVVAVDPVADPDPAQP